MPWHQSKSDPRKVYNSHHEAVCVCQTADQASLIIRAVNALPPGDSETFIKLREHQPLCPPSPFHSGPAQIVNTFEPDECCGKGLTLATLKDLQSWECSKCGAEWKPTDYGTVRHWVPTPAVMIFR